ncbi:hypothetical protein NEOLEDRAFT_397983 [Neolentinus lepideus HHB14362 ss-1]|uniref:Uncharacterized protein n=1 Tax=Neolentinus lepideus HHB14362 ss-1 TaxID=1314782 RepID=A0A165S9D2_9AGAM|nr:hypothetical protein NEOLEDRAFT_397983 [Neolentinus lepideus HHB14362 ss-1]
MDEKLSNTVESFILDVAIETGYTDVLLGSADNAIDLTACSSLPEANGDESTTELLLNVPLGHGFGTDAMLASAAQAMAIHKGPSISGTNDNDVTEDDDDGDSEYEPDDDDESSSSSENSSDDGTQSGGEEGNNDNGQDGDGEVVDGNDNRHEDGDADDENEDELTDRIPSHLKGKGKANADTQERCETPLRDYEDYNAPQPIVQTLPANKWSQAPPGTMQDIPGPRYPDISRVLPGLPMMVTGDRPAPLDLPFENAMNNGTTGSPRPTLMRARGQRPSALDIPSASEIAPSTRPDVSRSTNDTAATNEMPSERLEMQHIARPAQSWENDMWAETPSPTPRFPPYPPISLAQLAMSVEVPRFVPECSDPPRPMTQTVEYVMNMDAAPPCPVLAEPPRVASTASDNAIPMNTTMEVDAVNIGTVSGYSSSPSSSSTCLSSPSRVKLCRRFAKRLGVPYILKSKGEEKANREKPLRSSVLRRFFTNTIKARARALGKQVRRAFIGASPLEAHGVPRSLCAQSANDKVLRKAISNSSTSVSPVIIHAIEEDQEMSDSEEGSDIQPEEEYDDNDDNSVIGSNPLDVATASGLGFKALACRAPEQTDEAKKPVALDETLEASISPTLAIITVEPSTGALANPLVKATIEGVPDDWPTPKEYLKWFEEHAGELFDSLSIE